MFVVHCCCRCYYCDCDRDCDCYHYQNRQGAHLLAQYLTGYNMTEMCCYSSLSEPKLNPSPSPNPNSSPNLNPNSKSKCNFDLNLMATIMLFCSYISWSGRWKRYESEIETETSC